MKRYHLKYSVRPSAEGFAKEDVDIANEGLCDAILIASIVNGADGSVSTKFAGMNGKDGTPLSESDMWRTWAVLAHALMRSETLGEGKTQVCAVFNALVRDVLLEGRMMR